MEAGKNKTMIKIGMLVPIVALFILVILAYFVESMGSLLEGGALIGIFIGIEATVIGLVLWHYPDFFALSANVDERRRNYDLTKMSRDRGKALVPFGMIVAVTFILRYTMDTISGLLLVIVLLIFLMIYIMAMMILIRPSRYPLDPDKGYNDKG